MKDREAWHAAVHWVAKCQTRLNNKIMYQDPSPASQELVINICHTPLVKPIIEGLLISLRDCGQGLISPLCGSWTSISDLLPQKTIHTKVQICYSVKSHVLVQAKFIILPFTLTTPTPLSVIYLNHPRKGHLLKFNFSPES